MNKNIVKRILSVLIIFVLIFTICGCSDGKTYVNPPMWKVCDEETGSVIYMLGTYHMGYLNTVFPEKMYEAIDACDAVAVEVDIVQLDKQSNLVAEEMKLFEVEDAKEIMGDDYDKARALYDSLNIYNGNYEHYMPTIWTSGLSGKFALDLGMFSAYGADRAVINYANKNGKEVRELETLSLQYHLQADQSLEYQMFLLNRVVDTPIKEQQDEILKTYRAWKDSDMKTLEGLMDNYYDNVPDELMEEHQKVYDAIYTNRQKNMAENILQWLKNGEKVFVAVGTLHYFASPDIIDFLTESGYTVEEV